MNNELIPSSPPHIHSKRTITRIRLDILIALMPAVIMSVFFQGFIALLIILVSVAAAVVSDLLCDLIFRRKTAIGELEAAVIGVTFALMLRCHTTPLWLAALGAAAAVLIFKQAVGLMGRSYINPAVCGYLIVSFFLTFLYYYGRLDDLICNGLSPALIVGAVYLLIRGVIQPQIPLFYVLSYYLTAIVLSRFGILTEAIENPWYVMHYLVLTAVFIAPAYASSPATPAGRVIFGIGGGAAACALSYRLYMPDFMQAMAASIIIMNILSPLIERLTMPKSWRNR